MPKLSRRNFLGVLAVPAAIGAAGELGLPSPAVTDGDFWRELRAQFSIPANEAFFNTCTLGAMPKAVMNAVVDDMRTSAATLAHWDYRPEHPDWISGYRPYVEFRKKLAALIHAESADELAITQNATFGMNFLAHGLDMRPGDEVVVTDQEHPGGRCGWDVRVRRDGIVLKTVPVGQTPDEIVAAFAAAMTPRTRVLGFPHITSSLGIVMPVKRLSELAHKRGALALVDGAQAVGQLKVDVRELDCDAYYSSPHKWLLAPAGSGLLYVRRDRLPQIWTTLASSEWNNQNAGAYRLMQYGTGSTSMLKGFEAAVDFHAAIGSARVEQRVVGLANRLRAGLQKIPAAAIYSRTHPELAGAITNWGLKGVKGAVIMDALWERERIRVRASGEGVRQCCHIYNSEEEVDRTVAAAARLAAGSAG